MSSPPTFKVCECGYKGTSSNYYRHKKKCKDRIIIQLKKENEEYKKNNEHIRNVNLQLMIQLNKLDKNNNSGGTVVNNYYNINQNIEKIEKLNNVNIYNNLTPINFNEFGPSTELLENYHLESPESLAEFALNVPLKNRILCTDVKRQIIRYKEQGKFKVDPKMKKIQNHFYNSLIENANVTVENTPNVHDDKFIKKFIKKCCESSAIKKMDDSKNVNNIKNANDIK